MGGFSTPQFIMCVIVLLLGIVFAVLVADVAYSTHVIATAAFAYLIIYSITIVGYIIDDFVPQTMRMIFCFVGAGLYIASGSMILDNRSDNETTVTSVIAGIVGVVTGAAILLELFFVINESEDFDDF